MKTCATSESPEPIGFGGVELPYAVVRPYSKNALLAVPFGLTTPWSCALDGRMLVAVPVVTIGSGGPVTVTLAQPDVHVIDPAVATIVAEPIDAAVATGCCVMRMTPAALLLQRRPGTNASTSFCIVVPD